jgi:hypothetical protein
MQLLCPDRRCAQEASKQAAATITEQLAKASQSSRKPVPTPEHRDEDEDAEVV